MASYFASSVMASLAASKAARISFSRFCPASMASIISSFWPAVAVHGPTVVEVHGADQTFPDKNSMSKRAFMGQLQGQRCLTRLDRRLCSSAAQILHAALYG